MFIFSIENLARFDTEEKVVLLKALAHFQDKLNSTQQKIINLYENTKISGYLTEDQLLEEIKNPLLRNFVVLTYNKLLKDDSFDILNLPKEHLYHYVGGSEFSSHEKLLRHHKKHF